MSRHSKKTKGTGLTDRHSHANGGEAASESRFSHFVDGEESYKPFAEMKDLKPQAVSVSKASASVKPSVKPPVKPSDSSAATAREKPRQVSSPSGGSGQTPRKKVVTGYDPSADFGDILRQWEATGDPYAMPGKHASNGPGVGRRLKKDNVPDGRIGKLEDPTQSARKAVESMDFAQIFAQWESEKSGGTGKNPSGGNSGAPSQKPDAVSRSRVVTTGPRKDFSEILAEWEASQVGKNIVSSNVANVANVAKKPVVAKPPEPVVAEADVDMEEDEPIVEDGRPRPVWSAGRPTRFGSDRISGGGGFADIYDKWAAEQRQVEEDRLEQAVVEKEPESRTSPQMELSKLRQMLPQVTLDLHGLTAEEAERRVREFLQDSYRNGMRKICIIHGKGIHAPQGQGVLKDVVLQEIERSKVVREYITPSARYGGSGVLWLILKV